MGYYYHHRNWVDFATLKGMTFTKVEQAAGFDSNDAIIFYTSDGREFQLTHSQDCCESVYIESVTGDLSDLEGEEILMAEESSNSGAVGEWGDSCTWTFYKLATRKGYVDIRFYGSSNGYYSESASLFEMEKQQ